MMKKLFFLPLSALLLCLLFSACKKDKNNLHFDYDGPCHCGVENPLEDLEWLHNTAVEFESWPENRWAKIFICTYDSTKQGFIINPCVNVSDGMQSFVDCEGNKLGELGGFAGIPVWLGNSFAYSASIVSHGIMAAFLTQRLSGFICSPCG